MTLVLNKQNKIQGDNMRKQIPPWVGGPGEILKHGLRLLEDDSDSNRRLAMISIDNSVELMIKTYLGLPKRITGLSLSRKEYQEVSNNFNDLLDALERYAESKVEGIDLGEIEWFHRLRNELYHQGNGLTVEREKVEVYAQIANLLFKNLFGFELVSNQSKSTELLGEFMEAWVNIEKGIFNLTDRHSLTGYHKRSMIDALRFLEGASLLSKDQLDELNKIRMLRNDIIHGKVDHKKSLNPLIVKNVEQLSSLMSELDPYPEPE